ncbi:MAG: hypothetical protein ACREA0_09805, partial [bacterium]
MAYQTINAKSTGKITSVTAPAVPIFSLGTVAPVVTYAPWQTVGVPYAPTGSNPYPVVRPDTVYGRITDAGGHALRFTVNRWGAIAVATDPLGRTDSTIFDANGLAIRTRRPTGGVDSAVYSSIGLPTYVKQSGVPATRVQYSGWTQPDSVWTEDGLFGARYFVGANGRIDSVRVAGGTTDKSVTRYTYEIRGRIATITDGAGHGRSFSYAGTNGNRSQEAAGSRAVQYGYDAYGRVSSVSPSGLAVRTIYYSIINRPDSVRDGVNAVPIRYTYDGIFLMSVTDPKGQVYGFEYNALGWLTRRIDPVTAADQYQYSLDGELQRWTNRRGQSIDYIYDALHRRTTKSGAVNTATETWSYPNDTVIVAASPAATDTLISNRHGQVLHIGTVMAGQYYKRRYTYTPTGALDSVIPSGGGMTFQSRQYLWNIRRGVLSEIKLSQGPASTAIQYGADGLPLTTTFPGGDQVTRSFTLAHGEAGITTSAPYSAAVNRSAGLDAANRISRYVLNDTLGRQFSYDGLGRLVADSTIESDGVACDPHNPPENGDPCAFDPNWTATEGISFSYDSAGNRRDNGGQYTTGNRITNFGICTYGTDADGNVTSRSCPSVTLNTT